jgi:hypothetical protein
MSSTVAGVVATCWPQQQDQLPVHHLLAHALLDNAVVLLVHAGRMLDGHPVTDNPGVQVLVVGREVAVGEPPHATLADVVKRLGDLDEMPSGVVPGIVHAGARRRVVG